MQLNHSELEYIQVSYTPRSLNDRTFRGDSLQLVADSAETIFTLQHYNHGGQRVSSAVPEI